MTDFKRELIQYYNKYACSRNSSGRDQWKCTIRQYFKEFLMTHLISDLLEIGAGTGQDSEYFQQSGLLVTAIDFSRSSVGYCLKRGIHALEMDFYNLSFHNEAFGSIYAFNTLFHVPSEKTENVFSELSRVLKPGGFLLIGQRGGDSSEGFYSVQEKPEPRFFVSYEFEEYKKILQNHFHLIESHILPVKEYEFHWFIVQKE